MNAMTDAERLRLAERMIDAHARLFWAIDGPTHPGWRQCVDFLGDAYTGADRELVKQPPPYVPYFDHRHAYVHNRDDTAGACECGQMFVVCDGCGAEIDPQPAVNLLRSAFSVLGPMTNVEERNLREKQWKDERRVYALEGFLEEIRQWLERWYRQRATNPITASRTLDEINNVIQKFGSYDQVSCTVTGAMAAPRDT